MKKRLGLAHFFKKTLAVIYLNILGVEEGQFGSSGFGENFRISGKDDPGEKANEGPMGDDEEDLANQEQGCHLAHVRLQVLKVKQMNFELKVRMLHQLVHLTVGKTRVLGVLLLVFSVYLQSMQCFRSNG